MTGWVLLFWMLIGTQMAAGSATFNDEASCKAAALYFYEKGPMIATMRTMCVPQKLG